LSQLLCLTLSSGGRRRTHFISGPAACRDDWSCLLLIMLGLGFRRVKRQAATNRPALALEDGDCTLVLSASSRRHGQAGGSFSRVLHGITCRRGRRRPRRAATYARNNGDSQEIARAGGRDVARLPARAPLCPNSEAN